jgi:hypothetical protein
MTDSPTCKGCGASDAFVTREDAGGEYEMCAECGRRNDGLGRLQDRIGLRF